MTLEDMLKQYNSLRAYAMLYNDWSHLDQWVSELAELASGTPIFPGGDTPDEIFVSEFGPHS